MKYCPRCNPERLNYAIKDTQDKYCGTCGAAFQNTAPPKKYIGVSQSRGLYRITCILEKEFRSDDHVLEDSRDSRFGEDGEEFENKKIELVGLTATAETHPYICGYCPIAPNGPYLPLVSETTDGICENCDGQQWVLRDKNQKIKISNYIFRKE